MSLFDSCFDLVQVLVPPNSKYHKAMVLSVIGAIGGRQSFRTCALDSGEGLLERDVTWLVLFCSWSYGLHFMCYLVVLGVVVVGL